MQQYQITQVLHVGIAFYGREIKLECKEYNYEMSQEAQFQFPTVAQETLTSKTAFFQPSLAKVLPEQLKRTAAEGDPDGINSDDQTSKKVCLIT